VEEVSKQGKLRVQSQVMAMCRRWRAGAGDYRGLDLRRAGMGIELIRWTIRAKGRRAAVRQAMSTEKDLGEKS